jgi:Amt family ammonium transporter
LEVVVLTGAMISFLWIIISFSLVYAKDANGDGIMGFPKYYYMFAHTVNFPDLSLAPTIPVSIFAVFELSFALLTPTIVAAAVIGKCSMIYISSVLLKSPCTSDRVNVYGFLTFIFIWHLTIYSPIAHIVWHPNGYFASHEIEDFSGGIVVHMLASITVVATHLYLNWKGAPQQEAKAPKDPLNLLINAFVVWFLWFGINAGKAHNAGSVAAQSIVNTIGGVMMSILLNFLIDIIFDFDFNEIAIVNAVLIGLISTTPSSGYVTVGGSMIITIVVTISTRLLANWYMKEGNNAPYSVATLHGFGGSIAFLFTAFISYDFINNAGMGGLTFGNQTPIRHHLAAILAIWPIGLIAVFICLFVSDLFVSLVRDPASAKGAYDPTPLGPLRPQSTNVDHADVYKPPSDGK